MQGQKLRNILDLQDKSFLQEFTQNLNRVKTTF